MLSLIVKLFKVNLIAPKGLLYLIQAFSIHGSNLMGILQFSARIHPNRIAVKDEKGELTYSELHSSSLLLAKHLNQKFSINPKKKVAILCRNHSVSIQALIALSRLGADVVFLNVEMSNAQLESIFNSVSFHLLIHDNEFKEKIDSVDCVQISGSGSNEITIESMLNDRSVEEIVLRKSNSGNISVLTGGTSGKVKFAKRKPSIASLVMPFFALLKKVELDKYQRVYIAVPFFHGYGLAALTVSLILSSEIYLTAKFQTDTSIALIEEEKIEVAILVPTMIGRMLDKDLNALNALSCILSGGAPLGTSLVARVIENSGDKLFNLYGTSEAGFSVIATPKDLRKHPDTIGKRIKGVSLHVLNSSNEAVKEDEVGVINIKNAWSMNGVKKKYVSTGDLGTIDSEGYLFLKGRVDDMIVSGGENVYPMDVENVLNSHPDIESVAVFAIESSDFGKRLVAFVSSRKDSTLSAEILKDWLTSKIARYQMPQHITVVDALPMTATGKLDRAALKKQLG
ncbi:MAG: acyl-CoA synthetase (AMP-forming)/AMP-acid ligase II [Crocinitomicaceae bacterium]|jgi:acyl-CoA synthetase (AMP-forming)/AMP-acid ligase II